MKILLTLSLLTLCTATAQEALQPTDRLEQHEWLQQLVGEWKVSSESSMEPGGDPTIWESKESIRSIGGLWIVAEGSADNDGPPFTSLLTLGYDPNKEAFVGTWIDTMQTTLWSYVGHLDASRRVLTLETAGPSISGPGETARYRDRIELIGSDEKRMSSSMLGEDGSWTTFMTAEARRVQ
jgi:hypothetical protein